MRFPQAVRVLENALAGFSPCAPKIGRPMPMLKMEPDTTRENDLLGTIYRANYSIDILYRQQPVKIVTHGKICTTGG